MNIIIIIITVHFYLFQIFMLRYFAHMHILCYAKLAYYVMIYAYSFIWMVASMLATWTLVS